MECMRDGGQPWHRFASVAATISCVNELINRGFLEESRCCYRLTDLGRAVLDTHLALHPRPTPD
jgi:hypothetical protein